MDLRLGCGGWWGFEGGLPAYARRYDFVEANSTCYRVPSLATARGWRRIVPDDFEFAVKVPWRVPVDASALLDVLAALGTRYAVVHRTSPWWGRALDLLHDHGYVPVLETRGRSSPGVWSGPGWVVRATDPSFPGEGSGPEGGETYARLFGAPAGVAHHLSQGMVERVVGSPRKEPPPGAGRVRLVVHSYQMYEDAKRIRRAFGGADRG